MGKKQTHCERKKKKQKKKMFSNGSELTYWDRQRGQECLTPAMAIINQNTWERLQFQNQIQLCS